MKRVTLKERQRQAREEAILEAAYELLLEQGYAAMSMDALAARVGASKATLYQHFASKEELAIKVIARNMRQAEALIDQQDPSLPAIVRLQDMLLRGLTQRASAAAARIDIWPHHFKQHPDYQRPLARLLAAQTALVQQAQAEGSIPAHVSAQVVVALLQGLYRLDYESLLGDGRHTPAQMARMIIDMTLDGIRTRERAATDDSTAN